MNNPVFRINLSADLLPIQAFFNIFPDVIFLSSMEDFVEGVEVNRNNVGCEFLIRSTENTVERDVVFYIGSKDIRVAGREVFFYLESAVNAYLTGHPRELEHAERILKSARARFLH